LPQPRFTRRQIGDSRHQMVGLIPERQLHLSLPIGLHQFSKPIAAWLVSPCLPYQSLRFHTSDVPIDGDGGRRTHVARIGHIDSLEFKAPFTRLCARTIRRGVIPFEDRALGAILLPRGVFKMIDIDTLGESARSMSIALTHAIAVFIPGIILEAGRWFKPGVIWNLVRLGPEDELPYLATRRVGTTGRVILEFSRQVESRSLLPTGFCGLDRAARRIGRSALQLAFGCRRLSGVGRIALQAQP